MTAVAERRPRTRVRPFQKGDIVRIVDPRFVVRVGYPKELSDYFPEAERQFKEDVRKMLGWGGKTRTETRILWELAHMLAKMDGFGGYERSLHLATYTGTRNALARVESISYVQTGMYERSSGSGEDYEPARLVNQRRWCLLHVEIVETDARAVEDEKGSHWDRITLSFSERVVLPIEHVVLVDPPPREAQ